MVMTLSGTPESDHPSQRIMGMPIDDDGVERYLGCIGPAVFTAADHYSLASKSFARVSSIASGAENGLGREHSRKYFWSGSPEFSCFAPSIGRKIATTTRAR